MNRTVFIIGLLAATLVSGAVLAETVQQNCDAEKGEEAKLEKAKAAKDAEVDGILKKIEELQNQLKELNASKAEKKKEAASMKGQIAKAESDAKTACAMVELCNKNKEKLAGLKEELAALKKEISELQNDIAAKTAQVAALQKNVSGYESTYAQLNCADLTAGETAQTTIDQCTAIFSNWNTDQAAINTLNGELGKAKGVAARLRGKGIGLAAKATALSKQLAKTCEEDASIKEAEKMGNEDVGVDAILTTIDTAKKDLVSVKKIRILKPKVKKSRKDKAEKVEKKEVTDEKDTSKDKKDLKEADTAKKVDKKVVKPAKVMKK